jgi:carbonic anhydrase
MEILDRLAAGNARFRERLAEDGGRVPRDQRPYAVILGCADSRVSPEIAFDTGLGELFVVRVAGNVANRASIASIEYAVSQLGSRLVIVLAHERCGAVAAAIEGAEAGQNLDHLLGHVREAVEQAKHDGVEAVTRRNARLNAERLIAESEILRDAVERDGLQIATAYFRFTTGEVEFDRSPS